MFMKTLNLHITVIRLFEIYSNVEQIKNIIFRNYFTMTK